MSINEIKEQSGLSVEVSTVLFWHCLWLREAKPDEKVQWCRLLKDKNYRLNRNHK